MPSCKFKLLSRLFLLFLMMGHLNAQEITNTISMGLENDSSFRKSNLLSLILVIKNGQAHKISGKLHFVSPKGFRNLGSEGLAIEMLPNETRHIPIKFIIGEEAVEGSSLIVCKLIDASGNLLAEQKTTRVIEVNNTITINPLEATIYRLSNNDPIVVKVNVSNKGNIQQNITLVCRFPDPTNANLFIEQNATIDVKKDSIFSFTYFPSKILAKQSNYSVRISGFRNPNKEIFGNTVVMIQNISSVQQYQAINFTNFSEESQNEISSSYRRMGGGIDFYQLKGSGGVNIPSGYLFMRANVALSDSQQIPLITNTNLAFHQEKNEYTIGNINKLQEMTLVGRGASFSRTFEKNQKIELGFVDQNYNLIEENSWLKNGYGFFAKGTLQSNNNSRNLSGNYMYRFDPFEKAKHNVLGTEINYDFNPAWRLNAKLNGGLSLYELQDATKPSFAVESNYMGKIKKFNINGNYFFSTDYYPGNRRGNMQLQQNISTAIKNNNLYASVTVSKFSPKFYSFEINQESTNSRIELGNRFPKFKDFSLNVLYQYQSESSNSYNTLLGSLDKIALEQMQAHRMVEQISWINNTSRQSAVLGIETGMVKYPMQTNNEFQMKLNANYNFRKFNINSVFQSGSYYLSEYAFSKIYDKELNYEKLSVSIFYDTNLTKYKVNLNTGVSYIDDVVYGKSPSAFFNAKYTGRVFNTFLNSSWYNYSIGTLNQNSFNFEVGVTVNLQKTVLNPDKKGTIKVMAFYDTNNNNHYDIGEKSAANYTVNINTISLQTDENGVASYKKVPYGTYSLKQFIQDGWYYEDTKFKVNSSTYTLLIPLHQSGKMEGKVTFAYNATKVVDFEHRGSGISFSIMKNNQLLQKTFTDDDGKFIAFLPTGNYVITLDEKSLPANTFCETNSYTVELKAGQIFAVPEFIIKVKEKKINTKKFNN